MAGFDLELTGFKKPHRNDLHPTLKPVELMERAVKNSSKTRYVVPDPLGGSFMRTAAIA